MNLETISPNWKDFATSKRWIAQCQMRNDDKIIPKATSGAMHNWIIQFIEFHNKTPDELINEAIDDYDMAEQRLDEFYRFKKELIDRNSCITGIYGTLRGFYRHNKVVVQNISSPRFSSRLVKMTDSNYPLFKRVETIENEQKVKRSVLNRALIQEFASHLSYRDQTIHLCIMSSGLDSGDILKLTIGDVIRQSDHPRIYLNNARSKTFTEYKCFFSTEATERIRTYIKRERGNAPENECVFVTSKKFRKVQFKIKTGRSYRLDDELPKAIGLKPSNLSDTFRDAQRMMGVTLERGKQSPLRPKRWRKVFKTAASNAQIDRDIIKIMLGHEGDQSQTYEEEDRNTMEFHYEVLEPKILLYKDEEQEQEEVQKLRKELEEVQKFKKELKKSERLNKELEKEKQSKEEMKKENDLMFKDVLERLRRVEEDKARADVPAWRKILQTP